MKRSILSFLFILIPVVFLVAAPARAFDKVEYYAVLSSDNMDDINKQLLLLKENSFTEKEAYEGALLMKKSGLVSNTKEKLSLFKSGRGKLEASIKKDAGNAEYRFLRIIIQEHAPKIVKYRNELDEDSRQVKEHFKTMPVFLQQIITDYSKKSTVLKNL